MLLQTNSYVVTPDKRSQHARLVRRYKVCLARLGCDDYEVYEEVGTNWTSDQNKGRFVQIMRFHDHNQWLAVAAAERDDPVVQALFAEFSDLINLTFQQQRGLFSIEGRQGDKGRQGEGRQGGRKTRKEDKGTFLEGRQGDIPNYGNVYKLRKTRGHS
jgi:hypothetical protein